MPYSEEAKVSRFSICVLTLEPGGIKDTRTYFIVRSCDLLVSDTERIEKPVM